MSVWMNMSYNFGDTYKIITISMRTPNGLTLHRLMQAMTDEKSVDYDRLADMVAEMIYANRPALHNQGLVIVLMNMSSGRMMWEFTVTHPSFPRVKAGGYPEPELLELCPVCEGPVTKVWRGVVREQTDDTVAGRPVMAVTEVILCSEACHNSFRDARDTKIIEGEWTDGNS